MRDVTIRITACFLPESCNTILDSWKRLIPLREVYFDYGAGAQRQGKNLLIIEHTEDADASLEVSTSTNASGYNLSGTAAMTMVKHFHIVCYDAGDQQYIPVDQRDGAFSLAPSPGVRIRESALLTSRKGYESWGDDLPAHHIYSTAKNGARIMVDKRSLWQRKALQGSRLRSLIWGILAAFLVVAFITWHDGVGSPVRPWLLWH